HQGGGRGVEGGGQQGGKLQPGEHRQGGAYRSRQGQDKGRQGKRAVLPIQHQVQDGSRQGGQRRRQEQIKTDVPSFQWLFHLTCPPFFHRPSTKTPPGRRR